MENVKRRTSFRMCMILCTLAVGMIIAGFPQKVQADTIVKKVELTCDVDQAGLLPGNKEIDVQSKLKTLVHTGTKGLSLDNMNIFLMYWNETDDGFTGIGSGTGQVQESRQYYLRYTIELGGSYDWPGEVKALKHGEYYPGFHMDDFSIYYNGIERGDVFLQYNDSWNMLIVCVPIANQIYVSASPNTFIYNGKEQKPSVTSVTTESGTTVPAEFYEMSCVDDERGSTVPVEGGSYLAIVEGKGIYESTAEILFSIKKAPNPLKISPKTATVKYSKLKKKAQTLAVTKVIRFKKKAGDKKNYTLLSAKKGGKSVRKYFNINKSSGKVTVKKGLRKGTYTIKVKVKALGNRNYKKSGEKTVTCKIKIQ